jgi:hypothetical protein
MARRSMIRRISVAGIATVLLTSAEAPLSAQSLGDVARREAERRTQVTSGRVYTNEDLAPVDPAQPTPPAATGSAAAEAAQSPGKEAQAAAAKPAGLEGPATKPRVKRDEQYWRTRAKELRGRLAQAEADAAAADARLQELDAAPQTPALAREREVVARAVARMRSAVRYLRDEVSQFEALAESNNVSPDWIR